MKRRDIVAATSLLSSMGTSGCVGSLNRAVEGNVTRRTVSVGSVDDPSDEHGVAFEVEVLQPTMHAEEPARIEIAMQNVTEGPMMIPTGNREVWSWGPDFTEGLIIYARDQRKGATVDKDECWVVTTLADQSAVLIEANLDPGERINTTREVLADGRYVDGCPPAGEYRFGTNYWVFESGREEEKLAEFYWEFALEVE